MSCLNSRCSCDLPFHYIVLLKKMRKHPSQLPMYKGIEVIKHIRRVIVADNPIAVPLTCIKAKCMRIEVDTVYVCHLPNCSEKDWGMEYLYCNNFYWVRGLLHLFHLDKCSCAIANNGFYSSFPLVFDKVRQYIFFFLHFIALFKLEVRTPYI